MHTLDTLSTPGRSSYLVVYLVGRGGTGEPARDVEAVRDTRCLKLKLDRPMQARGEFGDVQRASCGIRDLGHSGLLLARIRPGVARLLPESESAGDLQVGCARAFAMAATLMYPLLR